MFVSHLRNLWFSTVNLAGNEFNFNWNTGILDASFGQFPNVMYNKLLKLVNQDILYTGANF